MGGRKTLLIGTTAINRSKLHKDIIPSWYKYINALDRSKYNIRWFVNIDYIEKLGEDVLFTKKRFQNYVSDIPLIFIEKEKNDGNFLKACKNIASQMEEYVADNQLHHDDVIIMWLEDDWKLSDDVVPMQNIIENYLSNMTYINLNLVTINNYIHALAPSIMSYNLWSQIHLPAWLEAEQYIDPEHCAGLYFLKQFSKFEDVRNITVIQKTQNIHSIFVESSKNIYSSLSAAKYFQSDHSFYTYEFEGNYYSKNNKYVAKNEVISFNKDVITFVRILPSYCIDGCQYGRKFMETKFDLIKNKNNVDFYKEKK
jgi:hypothetical protein